MDADGDHLPQPDLSDDWTAIESAVPVVAVLGRSAAWRLFRRISFI
jgi:hypothetical protein